MTAAQPTTQAAPAARPYLIAVVTSLAAFMEVLDTTIVNVSLSHIGSNFAASPNESTWVLTSYLVANGIVLPLSGWFASVIGRKNYFLLSIAGFTAASFACGMSTSLPMLIVFRLLQGLTGGGLQPMQLSIVMDAFPPEKRGTAFAITGMTMIVAPIFGPTLGGLITDSFSWRWIFFMNVPIGMLAIFLVNRVVEDPLHAQAKGLLSIDYIGLSLVVLGIGALQVVLDKGQEEDWFGSDFIVAFSSISVISLSAAIIWLLRQKEPIIDIRLLANRSFGLACLMIFFMGFILYSCSTLLPLLVQSQFGYDATLAGFMLSPSGLALIFLMPFAGKLANKMQPHYLIAFGMLTIGAGMLLTATQVTPQTSFQTFVILRTAQVIGLPFLFIPCSTLAFSNIPLEKSNKASALYSLLRNLGGSTGISIMASYVSRHEQSHQSSLGEHLTASNSAYRALLSHYTDTIMGLGAPHTQAYAAAVGRLYQQLLGQASILAHCDASRFLGVIAFALAFIALLMPRDKLLPSVAEEPAHTVNAAGH